MGVALAMQLAVYLSSHDVDEVWCQHKWCPLSLEALHSEQQHHCEREEITVIVLATTDHKALVLLCSTGLIPNMSPVWECD